MIGRLRGLVVEKQGNILVLDVQGVGYIVLAPTSVVEEAGLDQELTLSTYLQVREDALTLYGFTSADDKSLFELLLSVSGVGPKIALAIFSTYTAEQVRGAVSAGNAAFFSSVTGIGKKNAERIILELKGKVWASSSQLPLASVAVAGNELVQALISLGYTMAEAQQVSQEISSELPLNAQIKQALLKLGQ
jgi:Holliday junction DNA helicase RuvA